MNLKLGDAESPHWWMKPITVEELPSVIETVVTAHGKGQGLAGITMNRIEIALNTLLSMMQSQSSLKFVTIGYLGHQTVYVNVTKEEAIARYNKENPDYTAEDAGTVREIEVKDGKFEVYDIWDNE